jgi:aminoglycoside phosphotransferase
MSEILENDATVNHLFSWAVDLLGSDVSSKKARSRNTSKVYELTHDETRSYLKIDSGLEVEYNNLQRLQGKMPTPKVIGFTSFMGQDALLTAALDGRDLAHLCQYWSPQLITSKLCSALKQIHSADISDWSHNRPDQSTLIHGDACLPNFIFKTTGEFSGFVDLGDMRIGNINDDLAAAVWSIDFNLGSGHGLPFLREYGIVGVNETMVEDLRLSYEIGVLKGELPVDR